MRTIGQTIKKARVRKKYSRARLEEATKIKKGFIEAIENENWEKLPEYPVLHGFISSIAKTLKVDVDMLTAILRRDYPPKKLDVNPKPDVSEKFSWSPRLTFLASSIVISVAILAYLVFQYMSFISPPRLEIFEPKEGQEIATSTLVVEGKTDSDVVVRINNQSVLINDEGDFSEEINIFEGTGEIEIVATSRSGRITIIKRRIVPKLDN
jgi:cytoskeletal protein RodZ